MYWQAFPTKRWSGLAGIDCFLNMTRCGDAIPAEELPEAELLRFEP
jgi:hypothetical protein